MREREGEKGVVWGKNESESETEQFACTKLKVQTGAQEWEERDEKMPQFVAIHSHDLMLISYAHTQRKIIYFHKPEPVLVPVHSRSP